MHCTLPLLHGSCLWLAQKDGTIGLTIAGSLACWILGSFYWHCCNISSGVYKGVGSGREVANGNKYRVSTSRGTLRTGHMPSKTKK